MTPDLAYFEKVAAQTVANLPHVFQTLAQDVVLHVEDWPSAQMMSDLGVEDPCELTGLYEGIPVTQKSVMDIVPSPDVVWLFREPILSEWRARKDVELDKLIAHVVIHEFAHHFGWSDDDISEVDQWWL